MNEPRDELTTWFIGFCCGAIITGVMFVLSHRGWC